METEWLSLEMQDQINLSGAVKVLQFVFIYQNDLW